MVEKPDVETTGREFLARKLWRNRKAILLWGTPLLLGDLSGARLDPCHARAK
jgi:hypothetical protein